MVSGQAVSNTFHIADPGAGSPPGFTDLLALADEVNTWLGTEYRQLMSDQCTHDAVIARQVSDPLNPVIVLEATKTVGVAGTRSSTGNHIPEAICAVIAEKTPNASRRFRGHMFAPPAVNQAAVNGDNLATTDAYWTALAAYIAKLQAGCQPTVTWTGTHLASYELSIYSKKAASLGQPNVAAVSLVTPRLKAAWLRSRERGGS